MNNKRNFIKNSIFAGFGLSLISKFQTYNLYASNNNILDNITLKAPFSLPNLNYSYNSLEPNFDSLTMEIHYTKHHKAYIDNLNKAIDNTEFANLSLLDILGKLNGDKKQNAIRNNAGGHFNHTFWWDILTPKQLSGVPVGELANQINNDFGDFNKFKIAFESEAKSRFGSGWAWLVYDKTDNKLKVTNTPNQDNTLMSFSEIKGEPIIGIDVWEHAYYLKYQNKRVDYISAFWNVIDWNKAELNFKKSK